MLSQKNETELRSLTSDEIMNLPSINERIVFQNYALGIGESHTPRKSTFRNKFAIAKDATMAKWCEMICALCVAFGDIPFAVYGHFVRRVVGRYWPRSIHIVAAVDTFSLSQLLADNLSGRVMLSNYFVTNDAITFEMLAPGIDDVHINVQITNTRPPMYFDIDYMYFVPNRKTTPLMWLLNASETEESAHVWGEDCSIFKVHGRTGRRITSAVEKIACRPKICCATPNNIGAMQAAVDMMADGFVIKNKMNCSNMYCICASAEALRRGKQCIAERMGLSGEELDSAVDQWHGPHYTIPQELYKKI